jgi:hypothetical protein
MRESFERGGLICRGCELEPIMEIFVENQDDREDAGASISTDAGAGPFATMICRELAGLSIRKGQGMSAALAAAKATQISLALTPWGGGPKWPHSPRIGAVRPRSARGGRMAGP